MQVGQRGIGRIIDGRTVVFGEIRQERVPENPARNEIHDVKFRTDDVTIHAQPVHARCRKPGRTQLAHDLELTVHGMGRGQQLARRLAAQDIGVVRRGQLVGRVGLAALELADREGTGKTGDLVFHPGRQCRLVEGERVGDLFGTGELFVDLAHSLR